MKISAAMLEKYDECNVLKWEVVSEGNPSILEITNVSKGFSVIGMCIYLNWRMRRCHFTRHKFLK